MSKSLSSQSGMSLVSVITAVLLLGVASAGMVQYANTVGQHQREANTRAQEDSYRTFQSEMALSGANPNAMTANPLAASTSGIAQPPTPSITYVASSGRALTGSADVKGYVAASDQSGRAGALGYRIASTGTAVAVSMATALTPPTFRVSGVIAESEFAPTLTNLIIASSSNPPGTVYRYTTDGTDPTNNSPIWLTASSSLPADPLPATVKAAAYNTDTQYTTSAVATVSLSRLLNIGYARSLGGSSTGFTYAEVTGAVNGILLSVTNPPSGTAIYYTYDGSAPTAASNLYTGEFHVPLAAWSASVTLRVRAFSSASAVAFNDATFTLTPVATALPAPTFGVTSGSASAVSVPVASTVAGAIIRYALDGQVSDSSPTVTNGGAITVTAL